MAGILSAPTSMETTLRTLPLPLLILAAALPLAVHAQEPELPGPEMAPPQAQTRWEGALGMITSYAPTYQGASKDKLKLHPGFFLRYGRFTITNASGFVTRRADDVSRGLGVDLSRPESNLRMNLALRFDAGRTEGTDPALAGLGDVKPTVRARFTAGWRLEDGWRTGFSWSVDAFGRGGGNFGDVNVGREIRLSPHTVWNVGVSLSAAGDRYMQTYYGVNEEQAARTGYRVYEPGAGLRDIAVATSFRTELSDRWLLLGGAGASRLVGPPVDSPITQKLNGWGMNVGLAWRF